MDLYVEKASADRKDRYGTLHLGPFCCSALLRVSLSLSLSLSRFSFRRVCDTVIRCVIPSRPAVRRLHRCAI